VTVEKEYPYWHSTDFAWVKTEPNTKETQLASVAANLDKLLASGQDATALRRRFEPKNGKSFEAQSLVNRFSWAYLTYKMLRSPASIPLKARDSQLVHAMHLLAIKPTSDEIVYLRLRFLIKMNDGQEPRLLPIGEKLLSLNANDSEVSFWVAALLSSSKNPTDLERAERMIKPLIEKHPQDSSYNALQANIAWSRYINSGQQSDGQNAIDLYVLSHSQTREVAWKRRARSIIRFIASDMEKKGLKANVPPELQ
jgi:predicted Zn-dependent protease